MPKRKAVHCHSYLIKIACRIVDEELANEVDSAASCGGGSSDDEQLEITQQSAVSSEQHMRPGDDSCCGGKSYPDPDDGDDSDPPSLESLGSSSGYESSSEDNDSDPSSPDNSSSGENSGDEDPDVNPLQNDLCIWCVQHGISNIATNDLLGILKERHRFLPLDIRTLKETLTRTEIKQPANGKYTHIGLRQSLILKMCEGLVAGCRHLALQVFIDGVSLYKSSTSECWPIIFTSRSFLEPSPGIVGLFYGKGKPNRIEDYLEDYIEEIRILIQDGIMFRGTRYTVGVKYYLADAPGRAYLKCIMGHASANGCERCDQEGDFLDFQTYQTNAGNLRTDQSFNERRDAEHHHRQISPLAELQTGFISMFPLDPLHLLDLGIFKRFLIFVLRRGPVNSRMRAADIQSFADLLTLLSDYIPIEFNRKPVFERHSTWKAAEFRLLFVYLGPVIFLPVLNDEVYQLFLLLHAAVFIYSNNELIQTHLHYAKESASQFVQFSAQVFGPHFVVYNEHRFLHLGDDVKRFGRLSCFNAYPFESMLGDMKRLIRSPAKPLQQLHRRLQEKSLIRARAKRRRVENRLTLAHTHGPRGNLHVLREFSKFENKFCTLYIHEPDNCVRFTDGKWGLIQNFVTCRDGRNMILAKMLTHFEDFYDYPMPSSHLGIVTVSNLEGGLSVYRFPDISEKCCLFPVNEGRYVAVPLSHRWSYSKG